MMKNKYKGDGLYYFKKFIPEGLLKKKSEEHFNLIMNRRWSLVEGQKVLDVGCGYGEFINYNPRKLDVHGVDIKKSDNPKVKFGDLNKKIPYPSNSFDSVTGFHVLEHLREPENALSEIKRVLKKDGRIILSVPSHSFRKFYTDYTHVRPYPKKALYNILAAHGFTEIKIMKGHHFGQVINSMFFFFPKLRWKVEKIVGKALPWEITAVARCSK